jgi:hypothetical protein
VPTATPIQDDETKEIGINFDGQSPHVFKYRFWKKEPGDNAYQRLRDGDTVDDVPDHFNAGPYPDSTRLAYWVAIAGNPNTAFRFSVILVQETQVPPGGHFLHEGTTSASGGAVIENEVVLI